MDRLAGASARSSSLLPSQLDKNLADGVEEIDHGRDDGVRHDNAHRRAGEVETKSPVDHSESHENATIPDMGIADSTTTLV